MADTPTTGADAYQDLQRLRERIDHSAGDFYGDDPNAALKFDRLLVELERESRGIFETLWGDQTPLTETDRVDVEQPTDNAAMPLVYPINDVTQVEYKVSLSSEWTTLDTEWYTSTNHRLILTDRPNINAMRIRQNANPLTDAAERPTWAGLAEKVRVTYDRGFGTEPPADILNIQVRLIENMLSSRKAQQTQAAGSPEELAQAMSVNDVATEAIRESVNDVTKPGLSTISV